MRKNIIRATVLTAAFAAFGCKKGKSDQAVVEEVPAATAVDSATAMTEEPALQSVGGNTAAPATFHPTGDGFSANGHFVVQLAVFKGRKQANNLVENLKASGYPAYVASVEDPTPDLAGTWYRVRIGNFATAKDAKNFGEGTLRGQGHDFWVDNKSNDHKAIVASEESGSYSAPAASSYSEPAPSSASSYTAPSEPPPAPAEPVGVPEPPPPATEPPPAQDSWGTPASDASTPVPAAPKDTAEGW